MIRFFTHDMPAGKLADFAEDVQAPWGCHQVRGSIVLSQSTNEPTVLWPKMGRWMSNTPATRHDTEQAAKYILDRWRQFQARAPR